MVRLYRVSISPTSSRVRSGSMVLTGKTITSLATFLGLILHPNQNKEHIQIFHVFELMDQDRNVSDIMVDRSLGDDHIDPMDSESGGRLNEVVQEEDLLCGELLGDHIRKDVQIRAFPNQISGCDEILLPG